MSSKEYTLPNGKVAVFEYDIFGIGKITLECMDELMSMIAERPQGEWKNYKDEHYCTNCGEVVIGDWYTEDEWYDFCPNCGAKMDVERKESE